MKMLSKDEMKKVIGGLDEFIQEGNGTCPTWDKLCVKGQDNCCGGQTCDPYSSYYKCQS